ncbi:hypothetical protein M0802_005336 [Mischocyttarus mexicanus]|nr:hypothetical protein M0802_005336 [Mischocyttarus mexicanus]
MKKINIKKAMEMRKNNMLTYYQSKLNDKTSLTISTSFHFKKVIRYKVEEIFETPIFLLNGTLETASINITWKPSTFVMYIKHTEQNDQEWYYEPKFVESKVNDLSTKLSYNLIPDELNSLYASCKISINDETDASLYEFCFVLNHVTYYYENIIPSTVELYQRLEKIYSDKKSTDVKINVNGKEFLVHKIIISRSCVLMDMLKNSLSKNNKNVIDIINTTPEVFEVILKYLYIGETGDIDFHRQDQNTFLFDLMLAADFYRIIDLSIKLINTTMKHLSSDNVIPTLMFAQKCNILNLKTTCMDFMRIYGKAASQTSAFKDLVTQFPNLAAELLLFILQY